MVMGMVKAVDIAKKLGISKATVSLALNDKPGVNAETRKRILECRDLLEQGLEYVPKRDQMIKVVVIIRGLKIAMDPEINLWNDVWSTYDQEVKKIGYSLSVTYFDAENDSAENLIRECNSGLVAGVILHATEMYPKDWKKLSGLRVPLVIYDNDFRNINAGCVITDDYTEAGVVVDYLVKRGCKNIKYLANTKEIYNFTQRRKGFTEALREMGDEHADKTVLALGGNIEEVCQNCKKLLENGNLPDAFVMENYQISIGVMRALQEFKIKIPEEISLIGFDEISSYLTGYVSLTAVRIEHARRAVIAVQMLHKEIQDQENGENGEDKVYVKISTREKIVEGDTVRKSGKA